MGRNTHTVAGPSGQSSIFCPRPSLGCRGPSSHNGPNGLLCGWESANIGAPHAAHPGAGGTGSDGCRFRAAERA
eukprot:8330290-Alexandrium_andersonii.AAC.1